SSSLGAARSRIRAAVGPTIAQPSYEVGDALRDQFMVTDPDNNRFFAAGARAGHWQFDLEGFVAHRLRGAGVGVVDALHLDTYGDEDRFFSYRRATHRHEADYGRQVSAIMAL
ncbi:MAG: laccase domain-containing protein, partial [Sphingomonadales bacterium]